MKELEFPLLKIITPNKSLALKREQHQTEMTFSDTKMHWILRQLIHYILRHQSEYISFSLHKKIQQHSEFLNEYFLSGSLIQVWSLDIFYISSVLHIWASWTKAFLLFCDWNNFFSKPVDRSTPSHRYPGMIPKRFGAGGGPLYLGYSENSKKNKIF